MTNAYQLRLEMTKPKSFAAILDEVGFSHNTLQQHLMLLMARGIIVREKDAASGFGRPRFTYHTASKKAKQVTAVLEDPSVDLVSMPFSHLRHVCKFEKGGDCKKTKKIARLKTAHKSENKNL